MVDSLFTSQTQGIKHRSKIFKNAWKSHLENSKQAIRDTFLEDLKKGKTLSVLGCGELLDFPSDIFSEYKNQIYLIDKSKEALSKFTKNTILYDLTGNLDSWSSYLHDLKINDITSFLNELKNLPQKRPLLKDPSFKDELVLSLNLLSQLPVYWQDSVFSIVDQKFSKQISIDNENEILKALLPSSQELIKSHVHSCSPSGKHKKSLIISDTYYLHYSTKSGELHEVMDALHGISIEMELQNKCNHMLLSKWQWDIVPQTKHKVIALKLELPKRIRL